MPNTQDEAKKEAENYLANSLDFLEEYKEIFEIHNERCLIDNLINTTKSFKIEQEKTKNNPTKKLSQTSKENKVITE